MDNFEDIINMPHPVAKNHPRMDLAHRAAQFAPFAALSGHEEAIQETEVKHSEQNADGLDI